MCLVASVNEAHDNTAKLLTARNGRRYRRAQIEGQDQSGYRLGTGERQAGPCIETDTAECSQTRRCARKAAERNQKVNVVCIIKVAQDVPAKALCEVSS